MSNHNLTITRTHGRVCGACDLAVARATGETLNTGRDATVTVTNITDHLDSLGLGVVVIVDIDGKHVDHVAKITVNGVEPIDEEMLDSEIMEAVIAAGTSYGWGPSTDRDDALVDDAYRMANTSARDAIAAVEELNVDALAADEAYLVAKGAAYARARLIFVDVRRD